MVYVPFITTCPPSALRLGLQAAAVFSLMLGSGCRTMPDVTPIDGPRFSVMTYNLYWKNPDPGKGKRIIQEVDADLVFIQEVTAEWEPACEALQYRYPFQRCEMDDVGHGNAVISRWPILEARRIDAEHGWHGGWYLRVLTPLGLLQIVGVHLMPPFNQNHSFSFTALVKTGPVHRREIRRFMEEVEPGIPLIILGDFNEDEHGAATSWLFCQGMYSALALHDAFTPTWKWDEGGWLKARIDHVFFTPDLRCIAAEVIPDQSSDHEAVVATLQRPSAPWGIGTDDLTIVSATDE